jgi:hypothetical protein
MTAKALFALLAAPFLASADTAPVYTEIAQVSLVVCGKRQGTAFRTGSGAYTSAAHVVGNSTSCLVDGVVMPVTYSDPDYDIATLRTAKHGKPLGIDCGGFIDRAGYAGVGYAKGAPVQRVIFGLASESMTRIAEWKHFTALWGDHFIPGMSGGPVFNSQGKVVGIVSGFNTGAPLSYSQSLSETPLCSSK